MHTQLTRGSQSEFSETVITRISAVAGKQWRHHQLCLRVVYWEISTQLFPMLRNLITVSVISVQKTCQFKNNGVSAINHTQQKTSIIFDEDTRTYKRVTYNVDPSPRCLT